MFSTSAFNQPIGDWDVSAVTSIQARWCHGIACCFALLHLSSQKSVPVQGAAAGVRAPIQH
jgi:hypothetical protein